MNFQETVTVICPYCGERNDLLIDTSVPQQEYIEDCAVCCRPMVLMVRASGEIDVTVRSENE